ncbi:MAG: GGDEF domain-containing protein [Candidatus Peregrinibacteria bacterium]|nr:GGDEF domain-containing protein [Candidatus Peregrinibacteria bacterium]
MSQPSNNRLFVSRPPDTPGSGEESSVDSQVVHHIPRNGDADRIRREADLLVFQQMAQGIAESATDTFWVKRPEFAVLHGKGIEKEDLLAQLVKDVRVQVSHNIDSYRELFRVSRDERVTLLSIKETLNNFANEAAISRYKMLLLIAQNGIDGLTGLNNRPFFESSLEISLQRNSRYGDGFSLVTLDIDHFKAVNDTYGHPSGDAVLRGLSRRLAIKCKPRKEDIIARMGGEEFAIILPSTPEKGAIVFAGRILEAVRGEQFKLEGGEEIDVTVSIGVAEYERFVDGKEDDKGEALMKAADDSLYLVKKNGRNQVACRGEIIPQTVIEQYGEDYEKGAISRSSRPSSRAPKKV